MTIKGNFLPSSAVLSVIGRALEEDIGAGDATTNSIVPANASMQGNIVAKQAGVIAGLDVAEAVYHALDESVHVKNHVAESSLVEKGTIVTSVSGPGRVLLTAERTALNLLGRISGIATLTRQCVNAVAGTKAVILDTRKTAPGLRALDKLAVVRGGGQNHRAGLYDMVLIKDTHIDFAGSLAEAVRRVRASGNSLEIEVEARTLDDVKMALELNVPRILLDNMSVEMLRAAVVLNRGRAKLEASGNVTLENIRTVAETGVDYISIGALTHSPKVFDVSFVWTENCK